MVVLLELLVKNRIGGAILRDSRAKAQRRKGRRKVLLRFSLRLPFAPLRETNSLASALGGSLVASRAVRVLRPIDSHNPHSRSIETFPASSSSSPTRMAHCTAGTFREQVCPSRRRYSSDTPNTRKTLCRVSIS